MLPPAPPPLSRLEDMVLDHVPLDMSVSFEEQCERVRRWLRAEVNRRLRDAAKGERVEVACRNCGEMTDVSWSHAEKLTRVPAP